MEYTHLSNCFWDLFRHTYNINDRTFVSIFVILILLCCFSNWIARNIIYSFPREFIYSFSFLFYNFDLRSIVCRYCGYIIFIYIFITFSICIHIIIILQINIQNSSIIWEDSSLIYFRSLTATQVHNCSLSHLYLRSKSTTDRKSHENSF